MSDALRFDDQVVIVTGAGGGLGRAHALLFAKHGAQVVVNDLGGSTHGEGASASAADKVVAEIRAAGGTAAWPPRLGHGRRQIVENALDAFGRVDVVVNNAGILRDKTFHKMEDADWDLVYQVHVEGAYKVTRAASAALARAGLRAGGVHLLDLGHLRQLRPEQLRHGWLGLYGLTRTLALEGRKNNILVNAIAPHRRYADDRGLIPPQVFEQLKPELVSPLVVYSAARPARIPRGSVRSAVAGSARYAGNAAWASASIRRPASTPRMWPRTGSRSATSRTPRTRRTTSRRSVK
ncbi:SDR family NAD(P)-dependent oxidoreductase [Pseudomonas aeruginosa]|nr:SDR family NAD(P)-dependent oxidoreductase [Pseudomonas aeruginosa]